jgi:hypothetical protein
VTRFHSNLQQVERPDKGDLAHLYMETPEALVEGTCHPNPHT